MAEPKFKALLIGCSTFPEDPHNLPTLKGPPQDLRLLEDALTHPQVGLHAKDDVRSLLNCARGEIMEGIEAFFVDAERDSQLLFYYSGHGRQDQANNLYLCASDTRSDRLISTGVSDEAINSMIRNSAAGRVVLILDCCHSGSFKGLDLPETLMGSGRFVLTSCRSRELAVDAVESEGASAFTRHLVEALLSGEVDRNSDGFVSLNEIYDYVLPRLKAETKQIPQRHFDHAVAEVALGRAAPPPKSDPTTGPIVIPKSLEVGGRPVLNVSETAIDIAGVKPGEELPPEIIDVFNEGGGALDWNVQCDDDWIRVERHKGFVKIEMHPKPGVNRGRIYVRDRGKGGSKTIRVNVEMAEAPIRPKLQVSETRIDFGNVARGAKVPPRTVRLANAGGGELRPGVGVSGSWINTRVYGEMVDVTPDTSTPGEFAGEIVVKSDGGEARIAVAAVVEAGPVLAVEPTNVDFGRQPAGRPAQELVRIRNTGRGELEWRFAAECDFVKAKRSASGISLALTGVPGRHRGTLRITSNGGDATIDVRAEVLDPEPPPLPQPPQAPNIRGRWNTGAGAVDVSGPGPQFQYVEYNVLGIMVGQGAAYQQGAMVQFQGYNLLAGPYTAQMQVMGNQMAGTISSAAGMMQLTMVRA